MLRLFLNLLLLLAISLMDYTTGKEVQLGTFYLLAVAIAAWNLRPRLIVVYALTTVAVWMTIGALSGQHFSRPWMLYWNTANRFGAVAIVATTVSIVRTTLDRQRGLIRELGKASLSATQLRELIPVCRVCHQHHAGPDYEAKLRQFLAENAGDPEASAVGIVCPDCLDARRMRVARIPVAEYFPAEVP